MSREIELLEKQLAFWKHHAASLSKALDEAEQTANHYADKTEEELNAERVQREDVTDINVGGKSEWISVSERLPENDWGKHWKERKYYLVFTVPSGLMEVATFGCKEFGWWVDGHSCVLDEKNYKTVTHWMPLPEAPKMKGGSHTEQWTFTIRDDNGLPKSFTKTVKKGGAE